MPTDDIEYLEGLEESSEVKPNISVFETWANILQHIEANKERKISATEAYRIIRSYPQLGLEGVEQYLSAYYGYLLRGREILEDLLAAHPTITILVDDNGDPIEEDEVNHDHIVTLYAKWQVLFAEIEDEWDINASGALANLYAGIAATAFYLGENGLVEQLKGLKGFKFTEEDGELIQEALVAAALRAEGKE